MKRYLLDTNHLSAYLDRHPTLEPRVDTALRAGDRFGLCLPVLCEYRAGIQMSRRRRQNLARLQAALDGRSGTFCIVSVNNEERPRPPVPDRPVQEKLGPTKSVSGAAPRKGS